MEGCLSSHLTHGGRLTAGVCGKAPAPSAATRASTAHGTGLSARLFLHLELALSNEAV